MVIKTMITAMATSIIVIALHYFPWRAALRRDLHPTTHYGLAMLPVLLPYTVLLTTYPGWLAIELIGAIWALGLAAGGTSAALHLLDRYIGARDRADEAEDREQTLLDEVDS